MLDVGYVEMLTVTTLCVCVQSKHIIRSKLRVNS